MLLGSVSLGAVVVAALVVIGTVAYMYMSGKQRERESNSRASKAAERREFLRQEKLNERKEMERKKEKVFDDEFKKQFKKKQDKAKKKARGKAEEKAKRQKAKAGKRTYDENDNSAQDEPAEDYSFDAKNFSLKDHARYWRWLNMSICEAASMSGGYPEWLRRAGRDPETAAEGLGLLLWKAYDAKYENSLKRRFCAVLKVKTLTEHLRRLEERRIEDPVTYTNRTNDAYRNGLNPDVPNTESYAGGLALGQHTVGQGNKPTVQQEEFPVEDGKDCNEEKWRVYVPGPHEAESLMVRVVQCSGGIVFANYKVCPVCKVEETTFTCSSCKTRRFCSVDCQKKDWKQHKKFCAECR